jgi:hypothetical protein
VKENKKNCIKKKIGGNKLQLFKVPMIDWVGTYKCCKVIQNLAPQNHVQWTILKFLYFLMCKIKAHVSACPKYKVRAWL